ncbi:MAG: hypothetical protein QG641_1880 [Candidatus Poribacteria bacterium]|nr:hypothetical protein [Candidatus Poribacteria bacterium]
MQRNSRKCLKYIIIILSLAIIMTISGCGLPGGGKKKDIPKIDMVVENPLDAKRTDEFIVLKVSDLKEMAQDFSQNTFIVLQSDTNKEIPCQLDDMNNDGIGDEIAMVMDMEPKEKKNIMIRYSPESPESRAVTLGHKKRTRSAIHPEYEGIGWESELIGYRLYPDQRNSISIFGKNKAELSLDNFAKNMGLSNAKIILDGGDSIGCGGFGLWYENKLIKPAKDTPRYTRIVSDGPVRSVIQVIYDSWLIGDKNLRVTTTYSIFAGQRWSTENVKIERAGEPMKIATGITKSKSATLTRDEKNGLFYTYGNQSKLNDALGMALIYPPESLDSFQESDDSYLAILNPGTDNDITYWFLSAWSRGEIGVKSASDFAEMVSSTADNLRKPITVTIMPVKKEQK